MKMSTLAAALMLSLLPVAASAQGGALPSNALVQKDANGVRLNFTDAPLEAVARSLGAMSGKNVVIDPKVQGRLTLISEASVPAASARAQIQNALRMQGFAVVETPSLIRVLPEADAKLHPTRVKSGSADSTGQDAQLITQVFALNYENAANVLNAVRPLISANNIANINPGNNSLIVTDYADNVARIGQIVAALDRPSAPGVQVIPLRHAIATEVAPLIARLVDGDTTGQPGARPSQQPPALQSTLLADARSNALIVRAANAARLADIHALIAQLDQPSVQDAASAGNLHVVHLRHADAVALAETLRAAMQTLQSTATTTAGAASPSGAANTGAAAAASTGMSAEAGGNASAGLSAGAAPKLGTVLMPSTGGMVQADPSTNSLLITAPAPLFRQLRAVIDRLDTRRAQVLVEALIVEVSDNKLAEFGVQWQAAVGQRDSTMGIIGTNSNAAGGNILNIAAGIASGDAATIGSAISSLGRGMNIGIAPRALGQHYLGALAHFLQQDGAGNILSRPNLMTLDNQEARIIIGNNVPFVTGSYASTGNSATVNPFTTVERRDVGLMLRIRPTINENGTVKLSVSQEVSNIDRTTLANATGPTTSKRSIESTVLVEDGALVMLGGLLQDAFSMSVDKVPLFGDIPVVGNLFKSENRSRNKTNLMVFLRPVVLPDDSSARHLALDRYEHIRAHQAQAQPQASWFLGDMGAPVLPPHTPALPVQPNTSTQPAALEAQQHDAPIDGEGQPITMGSPQPQS